MSAASRTEWLPDRPRQALNLAAALAQPITTMLCFATGTNFDEATRTEIAEPPIIRADAGR